MHFDEKPFICQCEKVDNKAYGFEILHFYELFSNDIMAVKGLKGKDYLCVLSPLCLLCIEEKPCLCHQAALHVNMSSRQWQDELDHSSSNPNGSNHPLDSHLTCDVLR